MTAYFSQLPIAARRGNFEVSHFAFDLARRRRRVRERLQKIMAELARERRRLPNAGG